LAQDLGERAVAVVLSGSGSDGSRGVQEVSKAGGTVLCESPDTAQFNGMPLSAMRTGHVDQVLAPEEIAAALAGLPKADEAVETGGRPPEERGIDAIMRLLRDEYGIDFTHYKAGTVTRRIERRLALNRSLDIDMYVETLRSDPGELSSLYEDLLIGVTRFFRDDDAFGTLEHRIIPEIVERVEADEQIRVWVPGCATGQEAYSIAMLLHERLRERRRHLKVKILATDVHKASLEVASAGVYTEEQLAGVGQERLRRYFTPTAAGYQVAQALRESIVFAPHNIIRDAPFTKMDLIACRNLLIYFQPHAQRTVLTLFHFALRPGGFLFLGSSETPGGLLDEFDTLDEHARIYRKRRDIALPREVKLPIPRAGIARVSAAPMVPRGHGVNPALLSVYDRLLDRFMPPGFLVDEHGQLVDTFGGVEALLKVKSRRPSQNLVDLLGDDLRALVSSAVQRVRRDRASVRYPAVVRATDSGRTFSLIAEPLQDPRGALTHILMCLTDADALASSALVPPFADVPGERLELAVARHDAAAPGAMSLDQQRAMEEELAYTREHLHAAVQEHETANEELQATNEELIAANEELQSTNEELHSVNEELYSL
jgi:two-component system CheB/CheR fusion protein